MSATPSRPAPAQPIPQPAAQPTPQRRPVPALIALSNATRARRPAGVRRQITVDHFVSCGAARALLEPLGLAHELAAGDLEPLRALADETRAITDALVAGRRPPAATALNRLAEQARATQTLQVAPDGSLTADIRWHADTALAELACRIVTELGRLDPARLRYCAREACDLLFYDTTRSRNQRWHSESPCGLRERQDRWRRMTGAAEDTASTAEKPVTV
ncbi:CGNR zinc finger domain-containing protein [Actinacidiphila guanduensis]|uniref:CGNR zinc finger domain-containing protein n=1 Tax=Actinacidiphila guanduensis TaxID=310781 RepID=A0A1H0BKL0_9ACTN|nr:CGNR zinc finger domain-containing protein [Actinacidiphila guanduensis]SDN46157.1 CGNR zinc finger domain-containing protein [Actinacidiphila guanduensis]